MKGGAKMDCGCIDIDIDGTCEFYNEKVVIARKKHKCSECGAEIKPGDRYEYVFGKWEGDHFTVKTCIDCLSLRSAFFCGGYYHENIRDEIEKFINDCDGDISEKLISCLTEKAREWVCGKIEFAWSYFED